MPEHDQVGANLTVREFAEGDVSALADLLREEELDSFERIAPDVAIAEQRVRDLLPLGAENVWLTAMAETGECQGFAAAYRVFPGHQLQPMWYLKNLYVRSSARSLGLGEQLMRELARAIMARGGSRLEFSTAMGNHGAIRFYRRIGVPVLPKVFYRIEDADLAHLASG